MNDPDTKVIANYLGLIESLKMEEPNPFPQKEGEDEVNYVLRRVRHFYPQATPVFESLIEEDSLVGIDYWGQSGLRFRFPEEIVIRVSFEEAQMELYISDGDYIYSNFFKTSIPYTKNLVVELNKEIQKFMLDRDNQIALQDRPEVQQVIEDLLQTKDLIKEESNWNGRCLKLQLPDISFRVWFKQEGMYISSGISELLIPYDQNLLQEAQKEIKLLSPKKVIDRKDLLNWLHSEADRYKQNREEATEPSRASFFNTAFNTMLHVIQYVESDQESQSPDQ